MKHKKLEKKNYTTSESAIISATCFVLWLLCMLVLDAALSKHDHPSAESSVYEPPAYVEVMEEGHAHD